MILVPSLSTTCKAGPAHKYMGLHAKAFRVSFYPRKPGSKSLFQPVQMGLEPSCLLGGGFAFLEALGSPIALQSRLCQLGEKAVYGTALATGDS